MKDSKWIVLIAFASMVSNTYASEFVEFIPVQSCFGEENLFGCSIRADNNPKTKGSSQPASFVYTDDKGGDESYAVDAAFKVQYDVSSESVHSERFVHVKAQVNKNNEVKNEQDFSNIGLGMRYDLTNINSVFDRWIESGKKTSTDYYLWQTDFDISYNSKKVFANTKSQECQADPTLDACSDQRLKTVRLSALTTPYYTLFESEAFKPGDGVYYRFSPTLGVVYDDSVNEIFALDGSSIEGSVIASLVQMTITISPKMFDNKSELQLSAQSIDALDRDQKREADFEKSSTMFNAAVNFALSGYLGQSDNNKLLPIFSVKYTNGSDSLNGKAEAEKLSLGLSLKY